MLTSFEQDLVAQARGACDRAVELTRELVACDTTARRVGDEPRDEARLQHILASRLRALGAQPDVFEPDPIPEGHPVFPSGLDFQGRPQLAATLPGSGGGRSLLLNGHIDAVEATAAGWTHSPYDAVVRDGRLYGRGALDMKGGIAALLVACEVLQEAGVNLRGDVVFATDTDEESYGAGSWALVQHGVRADAAIIAEQSSFDAWVACRGTLKPRITIPGRAGHTQIPHPDWRHGGPVNAIEKLPPVLAAIAGLRQGWRGRADLQHALLEPPGIVPTLVKGGTWEVSYPDSCTVSCDVQFLPSQAGADGTGATVRREITEAVEAAVADDEWLQEHPLQWEWGWSSPPAEIAADQPVVTMALQAGADVGRPGRVAGMNSWHDAASFTLYGGTPSISFGPGDVHQAHTVNESIEVEQLRDYVAAMCLLMTRFCGLRD